MNAFMQSARGAAAYTYPDDPCFQPLDGIAFYGISDRAPPARGWSAVVDELLRVRNLEDDWDGEGSPAPLPALVDGAITLAQWLSSQGWAPPGRVHASVNATVYFEWHSSSEYIEIEVLSPVTWECRSVRKGIGPTNVTVLPLRRS